MRGPSVLASLIVLGCARPPSTRPLGGEEWLPRERIADRKPRTNVAQSRSDDVETKSFVEPSVVVATSDAQAEKPVSVKPGEIEFLLAPLAKGTLVTIDSQLKLEANLGTESALAEGRERMEVRVLDVANDAVREVEVSYISSESSFRFGSANQHTSKSGKRFRVRLDSATPVVQLLSAGTSSSSHSSDDDDDDDDDDEDAQDEAKSVVFDLATVTGYLPLLRPRLPAKVHTPFRLELTPEQLGQVFGTAESVRLDRGWLSLRGLAQGTVPVAEFDCGLPLHLGRDGFSVSVELSGRCSVRPQDTRPLEISLSGPMRMEASGLPGANFSGRLEAKVSHSYSR
jgi:hypothetical protein